MAPIGTLDWLQRTGGRLAWHERLRALGAAVGARAAARLGARRPRPAIDLGRVTPPDSAVTREALALCQAASPPYLLNHCLRAYYWARLLDDGRRPFDDEALFAALLLHDLGLTEAYRPRGPAAPCFTAAGAREAEALAARHGWPGPRARRVAEAITLHLNVTVGHRHGPEAALVRAGSGADVIGQGLSALSPAVIGAVVARHPRLGLKRALVPTLEQEARERPTCRTAFLLRSLDFAALVRGAPMFGE